MILNLTEPFMYSIGLWIYQKLKNTINGLNMKSLNYYPMRMVYMVLVFIFRMEVRLRIREKKTGIEAINIIFEEDGLNYMVGFLDKLEPIWKINGVPVENWDELA